MAYVYSKTRTAKPHRFTVKDGKETLYTLLLTKPDTDAILQAKPHRIAIASLSMRYIERWGSWEDGQERPETLDTREDEAALKAFISEHVCGLEGIVDEDGDELSWDDLGHEGLEHLMSEWGTDHIIACANALIDSVSLSPAVGNGFEGT